MNKQKYCSDCNGDVAVLLKDCPREKERKRALQNKILSPKR